MKKVLGIALVALMAVSVAQAEETTKEVGNIGVGYQGIFLGDMLNGVAVRGTPAPIGWQVELSQGIINSDDLGDVDLFALKGKGYYALIERPNSKFYVGASLGYIMAEVDGDDLDGLSIAPLMGVEWKFTELPELGINFEVSYELNELETDNSDVGIYGINVSTGIIYYF